MCQRHAYRTCPRHNCICVQGTAVYVSRARLYMCPGHNYRTRLANVTETHFNQTIVFYTVVGGPEIAGRANTGAQPTFRDFSMPRNSVAKVVLLALIRSKWRLGPAYSSWRTNEDGWTNADGAATAGRIASISTMVWLKCVSVTFARRLLWLCPGHIYSRALDTYTAVSWTHIQLCLGHVL